MSPLSVCSSISNDARSIQSPSSFTLYLNSYLFIQIEPILIVMFGYICSVLLVYFSIINVLTLLHKVGTMCSAAVQSSGSLCGCCLCHIM